MKRILTNTLIAATTISLIFLNSCRDPDIIPEVPPDVEPTGPRTEIYEKIMAQFPEGEDITTSQAALFDGAAKKHVVLTEASPIYVTFISEGASFPNSFGYYIYNGNSPASTDQVDVQVLFPHVNDKVLNQGDRLQLGEGTFPAGTVVGFFLIIKGWEQNKVHYDRETFYTDIALNPHQQQQHVLFRQKELGDIVLTFEDRLTSQVSDKDYNDIIFTVTDNTEDKAVSKFDLTNVPEL